MFIITFGASPFLPSIPSEPAARIPRSPSPSRNPIFEDRVMKIGTVDIGGRVTVGVRGTILYDAQVGDAILGPLTMVAKGERLPAATQWEGSPANQCKR
jgi:hypothetical protein